MRVFILDDDSGRIEDLKEVLAGADISEAASFDEGVAVFEPPYDLVCLDHDLGDRETARPEIENTGDEFVLWMPRASETFRPRVFVHTHSPDRAEAMARELRAKGFNPTVQPFGEEMLEKVTQGTGAN